MLPSITRATQLINAERYSEKYGVEILFVNEDIDNINLRRVQRGVLDAISLRGKVGLIAPIGKGWSASEHSVPIIIERSLYDFDEIKMIILDSSFHLWKNSNDNNSYFAHDLASYMADHCDFRIKELLDETPRQADGVGCHADALEVLKDGLRDTLGVERPMGETRYREPRLKTSMMKTTQIPRFFQSQHIDKNEIYDSRKRRVLHDHIAEHSVTVDTLEKYSFSRRPVSARYIEQYAREITDARKGDIYNVNASRQEIMLRKTRDINMFLRAKSLVYIDNAVEAVKNRSKRQVVNMLNDLKRSRTVG